MGRCVTTSDCAGNQCTGVIVENKARRVVQGEDDSPLRVCLVENTEFDHTIMCEIDGTGTPTGVKVLIVTTYDATGIPTTSYFNLVTGAAWTGDPSTDLADCSDTDLESEMAEMCDGGTDFLRWYVIENGQPTGASYDTDLTGATYTTTGTVTVGNCAGVGETTVPDGYTVTGTATTPAPANVNSLTVTAITETVTVATLSGSILIPEGGSYTWGQGNQNRLDTLAMSFTGSTGTSVYTIHYEL